MSGNWTISVAIVSALTTADHAETYSLHLFAASINNQNSTPTACRAIVYQWTSNKRVAVTVHQQAANKLLDLFRTFVGIDNIRLIVCLKTITKL